MVIRRLMRIKYFGLLFVFLFLFGLFGQNWIGGHRVEAAPEAGVELQIQSGFDGKMKEGRWFPVKFTLTSPSEDFSGDLVVQVVNPIGGKDITYVKHLDLPKQSTKVVWMAMPGMMMNSGNNVVKLFKGSVDKGTLVPIVKGNDYIETSITRSMQVGVLARDPDTLNFLSLLNTRGYDVNVVRLNPADMPAESMTLDGLDVIALNDVASDQLNEEQIKAITGWVDRGGSLILAGGAGYPKTSKAFDGLAPVAYKGTASVSKLTALEKSTGKGLPLSSPFTVSTVEVKEGNVIVQEDQIPLFVKKKQEEGYIWYAAYDLSLQPLASWNGNPMLWEKVLQDHLPGAVSKGSGKANIPFMNQFWEMQGILDFFPSMNPPSFYLLLTLFIIYVVLAAPVLYFILKKWDKREWAWVIIPAFSVVSSLGIFMIGASDKSSVLTHTLNTIELSGSGYGKRTAATAVFVPSGGTYEIDLPKSSYVMSLNNSHGPNPQNGKLTGVSDQYFFMDTDKKRLQWTDVPYWSVRKAWIQSEESEPLGKFEVTAAIDGNGIKGEVTNRTKSNLTDVTLIVNRQLYKIGELKAGEKKALPASAAALAPKQRDIGQMMFPFVQNGNNVGPDSYNRERQMINAYMMRNFNGYTSGKPMIIGWSKDHELGYKVNGRSAKSDQLNMWLQKIDLQVVQGDKLFLPYGYIVPEIVQNNLQQLNIDPFGNVMIGNGDFTFEYRLSEMKASYQSLRMQNVGGIPPFLTLQIWNGEKQDWDPLNLSTPVEFKDGLQQKYILDGTTIRVKAITTQNLGFQYPEIALEGTVKP